MLSARTGSDYGLDATVSGASQAFSPGRLEQTLWGVPADPANDGQRYREGGPIPVPGPTSSNSPLVPFLHESAARGPKPQGGSAAAPATKSPAQPTKSPATGT